MTYLPKSPPKVEQAGEASVVGVLSGLARGCSDVSENHGKGQNTDQKANCVPECPLPYSCLNVVRSKASQGGGECIGKLAHQECKSSSFGSYDSHQVVDGEAN